MIIVDTNVTSELMPAPSPLVTAWLRARHVAELYTTSITLAEIGYGSQRLPDGNRKELLETAAEEVFAAFAEHVLAFDAAAAKQCGEIVTRRE